MLDLRSRITAWCDTQPTTSAVAVIRALLDKHRPRRIYDLCGHRHRPDEGGVVEVDEVGMVCHDGYCYTICMACCCGGTPYQSAECVDAHEHKPGLYCPDTVDMIARELGMSDYLQQVRDTLVVMLADAVPLHINELRDQTPAERVRIAHDQVDVISGHSDHLMYSEKQSADVLTALAVGLACLAYAPGGVTFAGLHWCVECGHYGIDVGDGGSCPGGNTPPDDVEA